MEEQLTGQTPQTQVGRALNELGVRLVLAHSPQAKGRIERLWGTFQDRLLMELRLAGASTLEEANAVLADFLPRFNSRFGVPAAQPGAAYQCVPAGTDLAGILCFKYQRTVAADNTVRFKGRTLQILPDPHRASYARHASKSNYGSTESLSSPIKDVPSSHRTLPQVPLLSVHRTGHSAMVTKTLLEARRPSATRLYLENQPPTTPGEGPSNHPPGQIH